MVGTMQPFFTIKNYVQGGFGFPPVRHFYRGTVPNLAGAVPGQMWTFWVQKQIQALVGQPETAQGKVGVNLGAGAVGAIPISICEAAMVAQQVAGLSLKGVWSCWESRQGVLKGALRGVGCTMGRDALFNAGVFTLSDLGERALTPLMDEGKMRKVAASLAVGSVVGVLTNPIDRVKTRLQADLAGTGPKARELFFTMWREGKLWEGAAVRAVLVAGCVLAVSAAKDAIPGYLPPYFQERP